MEPIVLLMKQLTYSTFNLNVNQLPLQNDNTCFPDVIAAPRRNLSAYDYVLQLEFELSYCYIYGAIRFTFIYNLLSHTCYVTNSVLHITMSRFQSVEMVVAVL